jgi:phosphotransferase system HPr (HPr) family protein
MPETVLDIHHEHGLHARPADLFVRTANKFQADIRINNLTTGSEPVNAKSILRVLGLGVHSRHTVRVVAEGPDAADALEALTRIVETNFVVEE